MRLEERWRRVGDPQFVESADVLIQVGSRIVLSLNAPVGRRIRWVAKIVEHVPPHAVVFGREALRDVTISQAVAASSAIPGFFEPFTICGRDYVDGGVGFSGHADLAAEAGADVVFVVHPLVPNLGDGEGGPMRSRGLWTIMAQASRIYGQNLLQLGLTTLAVRFPRTAFFLLEPPRTKNPLFGPSMGFEAARTALRFGYSSTLAWLATDGDGLIRRLASGGPRPVTVPVP